MADVLLTGATGFVGRYLCRSLTSAGYAVTGTTRHSVGDRSADEHKLISVGDLGSAVDWEPVLKGVDCVVHLAARVHVMRDLESDPLAAFRRVNVGGTERLLRHACESGVKRFVYISSVKVHGDATPGAPFKATDAPSPTDPYGHSKLEAERVVEQVCERSGVETVIIRPPLVYGRGVGGNFRRLLQLVEKGYPLPFGRVENQRSLVSVANLCDLIRECLSNESAAGRTFLVSDDQDVSTPELLRLIAASMSRSARLLPVPVPMLALAAKLIGQSAAMSRLTESLQVDIKDTMRTLNWKPPVSVAEGIQSTVTWHKERKADA